MPKVEHSVVAKCSREHAWKVFLDWNRWPQLVHSIAAAHWIDGEPWQVGSHMALEIIEPRKATVRRVITSVHPVERVGWISHVFGITMEQWVEFADHEEGGTLISTWIDMVGAAAFMGAQGFEADVRTFLDEFYGTLVRVCEDAQRKEVRYERVREI